MILRVQSSQTVYSSVFFKQGLAPSEAEDGTECGSAETDVVDEHIRLEIPFKVSIHDIQIEPLGSPEADAPFGLPGEVRFAGPDIEEVGNIPPFA